MTSRFSDYFRTFAPTMEKVMHIETISEMMQLCGIADVRHPLIETADLSQVVSPQRFSNQQMTFGFYMVILKGEGCGTVRYGQSVYDYTNGTMLFYAPRQLVAVEDVTAPTGRALVFMPELLTGTPLEHDIHDYTFFDYDVNESLHVSERERQHFYASLDSLTEELEHPVDTLSSELLCSHLTLLLGYCRRYYARQFASRKPASQKLITQFDTLLRRYFDSGKARQSGLPTVRQFADEMNLSPNYFGDMVKSYTGTSPQAYIQQHIISLAQSRLVSTDLSINEIAYSLGFEYPQYFSRLFKKQTGKTPQEYRLAAS